MTTERVTEGIVRDHFTVDPLFKIIKFEEQKTTNPKAKQCLSTASKNQTGKPGYPEFIVSFPALPDDIIIIECKAQTKFHESQNRSRPKDFAVDGVLHYASFLCNDFNIMAIAVSGSSEKRLRVSSFYWKKGESGSSQEDTGLLNIFSYLRRFKDETFAQNIESQEIAKTAIDLNKELNAYSIPEHERCTLVSAILLALLNTAFRSSYSTQATSPEHEPKPGRVANAILDAIRKVLQDSKIDAERVESMVNEYQKIKNYPIATSEKIKKKKDAKEEDNYVLRDITRKLESTILPLTQMGETGYDVLGRFYTEFIRYAGTDKKTGLVLTPQHIAEFFCEVANLNVHDVVVDTCCGTGGFLIAAMKRMVKLAGNNEQQKQRIREKQLIGVEKRTDMFTYACSNMMMRGDGKSQIYCGDSFSQSNQNRIKSFKPTVAVLNPPYDVGPDGQLGFIENALSCLQPSGRCVAIVQMSCVASAESSIVAVREKLLMKHTLEGVFSMPNDVFHPVGVIVCILVFTAHKPHPKTYKTFFGYFKNDGFEKTKKFGRIDIKGVWPAIKENWLALFINREGQSGLSVLQSVGPENEWCAEAYMETDYSTLTQADFETALKEYVSYGIKYGEIDTPRKSI